MTKQFLSIWISLCLLTLAGCTSAPAAPTQLHIASRPLCPLTPCQLPARPALQVNDDWRQAVDVLESELLACAAQVLACIDLQNAGIKKPGD